jgi:hypothetical protein
MQALGLEAVKLTVRLQKMSDGIVEDPVPLQMKGVYQQLKW